jgi:hypothetical protein
MLDVYSFIQSDMSVHMGKRAQKKRGRGTAHAARHLERKRVLLHVLVEIRQVVIRDYRLKVGGQAELLAECGGQRCLAGANEARDADEDLRWQQNSVGNCDKSGRKKLIQTHTA